MEASRAYGVAWRAGAEEVARLARYGLDIEDASGETHHLLPVPSVFIVGSDGRIRFVHSNADYRVRIDNEDLLTAARTVGER